MTTTEKTHLLDIQNTEKVPSWIERYPTTVHFMVLFVCCYFLLSAMMSDEVLAAAVPFIKNSTDLDSMQIGILYSTSFVPSLIFVIIGGFLHHKIGVRLLCIISSFSMLVGVVVFAMSESFWGMIVGRIFFGIGLGPLEVINDIIALRWFDTTTFPSIQVSFSIIASVGMGGCVLGFNIVPLLLEFFEDDGLPDTMTLKLSILTLAIVPTIAFLVSVFYYLLDWYATPILNLDYRDEEEHGDVLSVIKQLPVSYWLLFAITASSSAMIHVIMLYSVDYMTEKWEYSNLSSGQLSSVVYVIGIVVSPIVGWIIHTKGQMITILFVGLIFYGSGCVILGATQLIPVVGFTGVGIGLGCLETTLWTAVATVVPETTVGPAFAFLSAVGAIILVIVPFGAGWVHDATFSYDPVAYLCAAGCIIGAIATVALYFVEPSLQNPSHYYKQYFTLRIVSRKKHRIHTLKRRHSSIDSNNVRDIVNHLEETEQEDKLDHEQLFSETEPVFLEFVNDLEEREINFDNWKSRSLPKDFFSKTIENIVTLQPVDETAPEYNKAIEVYDVDSISQHENPDLPTLWKQNDQQQSTSPTEDTIIKLNTPFSFKK